MSIKIDKAIAKITTECEGRDELIPFEEYLASICTTDEIAGKILWPNKTLPECYNKMKEIARKRAVNGCAFIPPEEGYSIIRNYYGIELESKENQKEAEVIDIMDYL